MSENTSIEWADNMPLPTGRALGSLKTAARRIGMPFDEYIQRRRAGEKWCTACNMFHAAASFSADATRGDGLSSTCAESRNSAARAKHISKPRQRGRRFVAARNGDKEQARGRVNHLVNIGVIPDPNTLPCADCGHVEVAERRHEYDHYLGYAVEHHEDVQAVCTLCHAKRDSLQAAKTHCVRGHEFSVDNTRVAENGSRHCRACEKERETTRPPRGSAYWARVNAERGKRAAGRLPDGVEHNGFPEAV